nr:ankyrin repeat domain-containing protein [uncultured Noviherbaspirillum sp.]
MQIHFGAPAIDRNGQVNSASTPVACHPGSVPKLTSCEQERSLIPSHVSAHSAVPPAATMPCLQHAQDHAPALSAALQEAIRRDDWNACTAALAASSGVGVDDLALIRHAAQQGAGKIVFRLQGRHVSPFEPDMRSGAFYMALRQGNERLADAMLKSYCGIERAMLPDLKPCLEAAVENNEYKAMAWLLDCSVRNNSSMPFELLNELICGSDAKRVEIMISHPAFAAALNDPEAERLVLGYALRKASAPMLVLLLARNRSAANAARLCKKFGGNGNTLLHLAAATGDLTKLRLILDFNPGIRREGAGDSFFARLLQGDAINAKNNKGKTAWALAVDAGHEELATMLTERGARS